MELGRHLERLGRSTLSAKERRPKEAEASELRPTIIQRGVLPISDDVLAYAAGETGKTAASAVSYAEGMRVQIGAASAVQPDPPSRYCKSRQRIYRNTAAPSSTARSGGGALQHPGQQMSAPPLPAQQRRYLRGILSLGDAMNQEDASGASPGGRNSRVGRIR